MRRASFNIYPIILPFFDPNFSVPLSHHKMCLIVDINSIKNNPEINSLPSKLFKININATAQCA